MRLLDVPIGERAPEEVSAIIEMPKGSSNKYEYDVEMECFRLDRALYSPLVAPADYGWVAQTLAPDGDALDILVVTTFATFPGCVVAARPVGILSMRDEKGEDRKLLSVSARDPRFDGVRHLEDLPQHVLKEITQYFRTYKELEEKTTEVHGWEGRDAAYAEILACRERYDNRSPKR